MSDLEFRKFLTTYGISFEEYQNMSDEQKQELITKYEGEQRFNNQQETANTIQNIGDGIKSCGCIIVLIPVLILFVIILWSIITG